MQALFSDAGLQSLDVLVKPSMLLAFDFDGTLAPIVTSPSEAHIAPELVEVLAELGTIQSLAILTGRRIEDVKPRLGFAPHHLVGLHGAERMVDDKCVVMLAPQSLSNLREMVFANTTRMSAAGVTLEDKGQSLAFHYRQASNHTIALQCIDDLLDDMPSSLTRIGGKCVVNIVSAVAPDKAAALIDLAIQNKADNVIFLGDDENDEPIFQHALTQDNWLGIRVGEPEPRSRARFTLNGTAEVYRLLCYILQRLRSQAAAQP